MSGHLQIKRSSEAALLDAFVFTSNQFFFNRSTKLRVVLNFVSCFRQALPHCEGPRIYTYARAAGQ